MSEELRYCKYPGHGPKILAVHTNRNYWRCLDCSKLGSLKWSKTENGRAIQKAYKKSTKGKEIAARATKKYRQTEQGKRLIKETNKRYRKTEKGALMYKTSLAKCYSTEKYKLGRMIYRNSENGKLLRLLQQVERYHGGL